MDLLLVLQIILVLLFFGAGFALHILWIVAIIALVMLLARFLARFLVSRR